MTKKSNILVLNRDMMLTISIMLTLQFIVFGQSTKKLNKVEPCGRASYAPHSGIAMSRYNVDVGCHVAQRAYMLIGTGFESPWESWVILGKKDFYYFSNSASIDYRFLGRLHLISPLIHLEQGWGYNSKGKPRSMASLLPGKAQNGMMMKVNSFSTVQLSADCFIQKKLHIQVGIGLSYFLYTVNISEIEYQTIPEKRKILGCSGSISFVYDVFR